MILVSGSPHSDTKNYQTSGFSSGPNVTGPCRKVGNVRERARQWCKPEEIDLFAQQLVEPFSDLGIAALQCSLHVGISADWEKKAEGTPA